MARRKFEDVSPAASPSHTGTADGLPAVCRCIRACREKKDMEQKALALAVGVTANSVSNWENGRSRPDINLIPAICRVLEISPYELFGIAEPVQRISPQQQRLIDDYDKLSSSNKKVVDTLVEMLLAAQQEQECPMLRVLMHYGRSLAAGTGDPTELEADAQPVYVYETPQTRRADSIFRVNGDSMQPMFRNGQEVLVQRLPDGTGLRFGETGAFIVGNETYIKQYEPDGLHSVNPDYPVMHFGDDDAVFLIGRVIGTIEPDSYAKQEDIDRYSLMHGDSAGI